MSEDVKKISFGFSKTIKKSIEKPKEDKQFIDCLEGKSIKVKGGDIVEEKKPLVIPLVNKTTSAASLLKIKKEIEDGILDDADIKKEESDTIDEPTEAPSNESLEARAVRELLEGVKKKNSDTNDIQSTMVIPAVASSALTGEKESTLDDYEDIPISEFGMAMLRGMGWNPGQGMGKHDAVKMVVPALRPKGMGLGADKVTAQQKNGENKDGNNREKEELKVVKGGFVKITAGKHANTYGQVSGFDEDSGRLIIKAAIGGANLNLSEFMVEAVNKNEYLRNSKVINATKYEEYKSKENTVEKRDLSKTSKHDKHHGREESSHYSSSRHGEKDRDCDRERGRDRERNRDRDRDDRSSKSSHRNRDEDKYRRYSDSSSDSSIEKRSRDNKKRKGKKKRRDRSRSNGHRRR